MTANTYAFRTAWQVPGTPDEVTAILADAPDLARWWPSVYLEVSEVMAGDELGIGKVVELYTKGFLPYTLRWRFEVTESDPPHGFRLDARGDFVGVGIWTLTPRRPAEDPAGPLTEVVYDWTVIAEKGVLKRLSRFIKPAFSANHHWAMRRGEESLRLELARRRTTDPVVLAAIPAPRGPTSRTTCGGARQRLTRAASSDPGRTGPRRHPVQWTRRITTGFWSGWLPAAPTQMRLIGSLTPFIEPPMTSRSAQAVVKSRPSMRPWFTNR